MMRKATDLKGDGRLKRNRKSAPSVALPLIAALFLAPSLSANSALAQNSTVQPAPTRAAEHPLVAEVERLMQGPMEDPGHLDLIVKNSPQQAVAAIVQAGQKVGDRVRPLQVYMHGLAALIEDSPGGYQQKLQQALVSMNASFYPPDILNAVDRIVDELDTERVSLRERASLYEKTGGLPLPRKRQMNAQTGELVAYQYERLAAERKTLVANEEQLAELRVRYPKLLLEMGNFYESKSNFVLAYNCFSRSLKLDYEVWKENEARFTAAYLDAASFMILSAHRSDDVLALYHLAPMDPEPLQRRVVEQIDARTQIYASAADQYTNHASVNQALRDLLYTLIEDEGASEFLPEQDRRRFLEEIGKTALAKRHYQEAIGVYATLGDTKKLVKLGKKLSKNAYTVRRGKAYISRDLAWAIDAFREAGADDELRELLAQLDQAKSDLSRGKLKVDDAALLDTYWQKLNAYFNGGAAETNEFIVENDKDEATPTPQAEKEFRASSEELAKLIGDYGQQVRAAVPGQDVRLARERLLSLGNQAQEEGRLELALDAYGALGPDGYELAMEMIDELFKFRRYAKAYELLLDFGPQANEKMLEMAEVILTRGVAPRGIYNQDVKYAVMALIHLDEVEEVEDVLNELLKLRLQFNQLKNQAEVAGRATANRNLTQLEETLDLIRDAYDVVGTNSASSGGEVDSSDGANSTPVPAE